jgi:hypothetical protein
MERAGIEGKRTKASGGRTLSSLTFHSLRHSFNSALTNGGVSQEIRQKCWKNLHFRPFGGGHVWHRKNRSYFKVLIMRL